MALPFFVRYPNKEYSSGTTFKDDMLRVIIMFCGSLHISAAGAPLVQEYSSTRGSVLSGLRLSRKHSSNMYVLITSLGSTSGPKL